MNRTAVVSFEGVTFSVPYWKYFIASVYRRVLRYSSIRLIGTYVR